MPGSTFWGSVKLRQASSPGAGDETHPLSLALHRGKPRIGNSAASHSITASPVIPRSTLNFGPKLLPSMAISNHSRKPQGAAFKMPCRLASQHKTLQTRLGSG
jgi:hypothetical protein